MLQVDKRIAEIISAQHRALPCIEDLVKKWEKVALDLEAVVAARGSVPEPLDHDLEILALVGAARSDDLRQGIRSAITDLEAVTTRLVSDTVSVGVSCQSIRCACVVMRGAVGGQGSRSWALLPRSLSERPRPRPCRCRT